MDRKQHTFLILGGGTVGSMLAAQLPTSVVLERRPGGEYYRTFLQRPTILEHKIPGATVHALRKHTYIDTRYPNVQRLLAYKRKLGELSDVKNMEEIEQLLRLRFCPEQVAFEIREWPKRDMYLGHNVERIDIAKRVVTTYDEIRRSTHKWGYDTLISTLPLPALAEILGAPDVDFPSRTTYVQHGVQHKARNCGGGYLRVNYVSDPSTPMFSLTFRGDGLRCESLAKMRGGHPVEMGRIRSTEETEAFALRVHDDYDIRLFGRKGAWSPGETISETWENIDRWASLGAW